MNIILYETRKLIILMNKKTQDQVKSMGTDYMAQNSFCRIYSSIIYDDIYR